LTDAILRTIARESDHADWQITHAALDLLQQYNWPGNVRELEQSLRRAMILCDNQEISVQHLGLVENGNVRLGAPVTETSLDDLTDANGLLEKSQQSVIRQALANNNWNYTQTAQALGIGRTTLWRKVKKFNLKQDALTTADAL
jgi:DNA-binding NtrC family response regulator